MLVDLYEHICVEFIEQGEFEVADALLKSSHPLSRLREGSAIDVMRIRRLEKLVREGTIPVDDPYHGKSRDECRKVLAERIFSAIECVPRGRLLSLLGDAMQYRSETVLKHADRVTFDLLKGVFKSDMSSNYVSSLVTRIQLPGASRPECMAFHPQDDFLVTGSSDGLIEVYSGSNWSISRDLVYQTRGDFMVHDTCVTALAFDNVGDMLASGDKSGKVCIWRFVSGEEVKSFQSSKRGIIASLRLDSLGGRVYVSSDDGIVRIHGLKSGSILREFAYPDALSGRCTFSSAGRFYAGGIEGILRTFTCENGAQIHEIASPGEHAHIIRDLDVVTKDQQQEYVLVTYDGAPSVLMDTSTGVVVREYSNPEGEAVDSFVRSVVSQNMNYLYSVSTKGKFFCFDLKSGKLLNVNPILKGEIKMLLHHPNRAIVVVASSDSSIYVVGA